MHRDEVTFQCGGTAATVAPERGGIMTSLVVNGKPVLYLDRATLWNEDVNVRGGIPILFPFAGRLLEDRFVDGASVIKQHGYARHRPWRVLERCADSLLLELPPDDEAMTSYPFRVSLQQRTLATARGVHIEVRMHNGGSDPAPVAPGWHPYFSVPAADKARVMPADVPGLTPEMFPADREFDFGLAAPAAGRARFQIPQLGRLTLSFSPEMRFLQFWSQPGKDFICIEPFSGPPNVINTPARMMLAPGSTRTVWMRMELD
jgi:galactose mutarotase-like enzyme